MTQPATLRGPVLLGLGLMLIACFLFAAMPAGAQTAYGGSAFAASVDRPSVGKLTFADTGALPIEGGFRSDSLLHAEVPGVFEAETLVAAAGGELDQTHASASLCDVVLLRGHAAEVRASFVRAEAWSTKDGPRSDFQIDALTFGGRVIDVTGEPNQTIHLPDLGILVINEQTLRRRSDGHEFTINALRLTVPGVALIVLGSAHSELGTRLQPRRCHDFVTGGGWIGIGAERGYFALNAGIPDRGEPPFGQFSYFDPGRGMKVKGLQITRYERLSESARRFEGDCEIDGAPGFRFTAEVTDVDEFGRRADSFRLNLSNGYEASGSVLGGNLQLHVACPEERPVPPPRQGRW